MRAAYSFTICLVLAIYYEGMSVLLTENDFYDLGMGLFQQGPRAEHPVRGDLLHPQAHTSRGVAFGTVIADYAARCRTPDACWTYGSS